MSLIQKRKIFKKQIAIKKIKVKVMKKVKFNLKIMNIKFSIKKIKIKATKNIYEKTQKILTYQINFHKAIFLFKKSQHNGSNKIQKSMLTRKNTDTKIPKKS